MFGQPFGSNYTDLQNHYMQQAQQAQMPEYQMAKQTYEAGFMSFLGTKFSQEFVSSADGKVAADNLLATIRKSTFMLN